MKRTARGARRRRRARQQSVGAVLRRVFGAPKAFSTSRCPRRSLVVCVVDSPACSRRLCTSPDFADPPSCLENRERVPQASYRAVIEPGLSKTLQDCSAQPQQSPRRRYMSSGARCVGANDLRNPQTRSPSPGLRTLAPRRGDTELRAQTRRTEEAAAGRRRLQRTRTPDLDTKCTHD